MADLADFAAALAGLGAVLAGFAAAGAGFAAAGAGFARTRAGVAFAATTPAALDAADEGRCLSRDLDWRRLAGAGFVAAFFKGTSTNSTTAGTRLTPDGSGGETRPARPGGRLTLGGATEADGALTALSHVRGGGRRLGAGVPLLPARRVGHGRLTRPDRSGTTVARQEPCPSSPSDSSPTTRPSRSTDRPTPSRRRSRAASSWSSPARAPRPAGSAACACSTASRRQGTLTGRP